MPQCARCLKRGNGIVVGVGTSGENLVVLIPNDEGVFYLGDGGMVSDHRLACTNAVQTYVDLWHCGGRGQEAAEALLEQRLKPAWKAEGLKL